MISDSSWRNIHAALRVTSTQPAGAARTATRGRIKHVGGTGKFICTDAQNVFSLTRNDYLMCNSEILDWTNIHIDPYWRFQAATGEKRQRHQDVMKRKSLQPC